MSFFRRRRPEPDAEAAERAFLDGKTEVRSAPGSVLFDEQLGVYQRWYFEFRLKEEVARATRYSTPFAVMVVLAEQHGDADGTRQRMLRHVAQAITGSVRATDLVSVLDPGVFAVCLVHCDQKAAEVAGQRVEAALADVPHTTGGSLFPQDNLGPEQLVTLARRRAAQIEGPHATYPDQVKMPPWQR